MHRFRPAVALRLFAFAGAVGFVFVVEAKFAIGGDVLPTVGIEDGAIALRMKLAQFENVGICLVGVVEAVVGGGESLVVAHHQIGAELVVGFACGFEGGIGFPVEREGEGFKAIGRCVAKSIF